MTDQEQAIAAAIKAGKKQRVIVNELKVTADDVKRVRAMLQAEQLGNGSTGSKSASEVAASGAGNLSAEDKAALMGEAGQGAAGNSPPTPPNAPADDEPVTAEAVAAAMQAAGFNNPLDLVNTIVTLRDKVETLEVAVEALAKHARETSRPKINHRDLHAASGPGPAVRPATPEEERAYSISRNEGAKFDNIQEWRDAGSPGLAA